MPTYEYKCEACGLKFERHQSIKDDPLTECPECKGNVKRGLSGGMGLIMKNPTPTFRNQELPSPQDFSPSSCAFANRCGSGGFCGSEEN